MARCSTCALLIKEPWLDFISRIGGEDMAEAYDYASTLDESIGGPFGFTSIYCYGQQPEFKSQLGNELQVELIEMHEIFSQEHECTFHQLASGHLSLRDAISQFQRQRQAVNTNTTNISIVDNKGIININSTLSRVSQKIENASGLEEDFKREIAKFINELKLVLANTPSSSLVDAEVVADQAELLANELSADKPRASMLRITSQGLLEASKALVSVVPKAIEIANQILTFITTKFS